MFRVMYNNIYPEISDTLQQLPNKDVRERRHRQKQLSSARKLVTLHEKGINKNVFFYNNIKTATHKK